MAARPDRNLAAPAKPRRTTVQSGVRASSSSDAEDGSNVAARRPILIVEDDAAVREEMRAVLEAQGYEVLEAGDGKSALNFLTDGGTPTPGLVLLDLEMPVMSGWDLLALMRRYYRLSRIPVVLVTGGGKHADHEAAIARGEIVACLHKPLDLDLLVAAVAKNATTG